MAVEKFAQREFSEIASRQKALQTTLPTLLDVFHHAILTFLYTHKNRDILESNSHSGISLQPID